MSNCSTRKPLFDLRQVIATPRALEALRDADEQPHEFLTRHVTGDWGELDDEDRRLNDTALIDGSRILSAYTTHTGQSIWVIAEAVGDDGRRAATTLLRLAEY
jgi:hypothetical protein